MNLECSACKEMKSYDDFRRVAGGRQSMCSKCMGDMTSRGMGDVLGSITRDEVRDAMQTLEAQSGAFTKEDLARFLANRRGVLSSEVEWSIRRHISNFRCRGELVTVGSVEPSGAGRPKVLYRLTSSGVPVEDLLKEE